MSKTLFNNLPIEKKSSFIKKKFISKSFFQKKISNGKSSKKFSINKYSEIFRDEINRLLLDKRIIDKNYELEKIHKYIGKSLKNYNFNNGVNKLSQLFYKNDIRFDNIYLSFIKHLSENFFKFPFYFQETPTIRLQCPGGSNSNHYPRYHNDIAYGHPFEEINIWLPLTYINKIEKHAFRVMNLTETNRIVKSFNYNLDNLMKRTINESKINFKYNKISPKVRTNFGEMFLFDSRCLHSAEPITIQTRVSIDIRIVPVSEYKSLNYKHQGTGKRKIFSKKL